MVGYIVLVAGFFSALSSYGLPQALAFAGLWFLFGMFMLGIPSIVGALRTMRTFTPKEFITSCLAQCLLIGILYGALTLAGIQSMFNWFLIGGVMVGLTAPQKLLEADRSSARPDQE